MERLPPSYDFLLPPNVSSGDLLDLSFCLLHTEASNGFGQKWNCEKASGCFVYRQPVCLNISGEQLIQPPTLTSPQHSPNAVDQLIFWNQREETVEARLRSEGRGRQGMNKVLEGPAFSAVAI